MAGSSSVMEEVLADSSPVSHRFTTKWILRALRGERTGNL